MSKIPFKDRPTFVYAVGPGEPVIKLPQSVFAHYDGRRGLRKKKGERNAARRARQQARDGHISLMAARKNNVKDLRLTKPAMAVVSDRNAIKRVQHLRAEAQRLLRKRRKRGDIKLVPATGAAPASKLPLQVFEVIDLLDAGKKAIQNCAVVKTKVKGVEKVDVIPSKIVRIDGREFHRKHYDVARKFRKTRTELRLTEIQKKLKIDREAAMKHLNENGWHPRAMEA